MIRQNLNMTRITITGGVEMQKYTAAQHMNKLDSPVKPRQAADRQTAEFGAGAIPMADPWAGLFFVQSDGGEHAG